MSEATGQICARPTGDRSADDEAEEVRALVNQVLVDREVARVTMAILARPPERLSA